MQINRVSFINIQSRQNKFTHEKQTTNQAQSKSIQIPATAHYPVFTGGYSLSLADTIKNLDKLAQKKSNVYPPQIREWAGIILEGDVKTKDTLISIHKKFYESIKDCFSLSEVKKKFPEFKDVIPSDEVKTQAGSFIDDFRSGKLEYFDNDEDLSMQLLKLYWGDGFSLNDLKRYSGGKDLYHTLKKLNIPTVDGTYGQILKLSDPDYNARLTKEMSEKRLASLDRKAQEATGEPVFIKRGPLSEEHKKHISEGLLKYYEENPQAVYNLSERQRKFYEENPERAEIIKRVTTKAWYVFGADRIKNALSSYMKRYGAGTFDLSKLENPMQFTKQESLIMKKFWGENEWAKKSFSKNMTYAWKKVKEEQTITYNFLIAPKNFVKRMVEWGKKEGLNLKEDDFIVKCDPNNNENNFKNPLLNIYTRKFVDSRPGGSTLMANTYFLALLNVNREISKMDFSKLDKETVDMCKTIQKTIKTSLFESPDLPFEKNNFKVLEANEVQVIFGLLRVNCYNKFMPKIANIFNENVDKAYDYVSKNYKPGHPIKMNPYGMNL